MKRYLLKFRTYSKLLITNKLSYCMIFHIPNNQHFRISIWGFFLRETLCILRVSLCNSYFTKLHKEDSKRLKENKSHIALFFKQLNVFDLVRNFSNVHLILLLLVTTLYAGTTNAQTTTTLETNDLKITTPNGYLQIGPMNSNWSHFQTDRDKFYFNKSIYVNGSIHSYSGNNLNIGTYGQTQLTILESNGNVGIGTTNPTNARLEVIGNLKTTDRINASQYISVDKEGAYRVALNGQSDGYIVGRNDEVEKKFLISTKGNTFFNGGNVGIGTNQPLEILDIRGKVLIENGTNATIFTGIGSEELYRYLTLINSPDRTSASGLKAGGVLVADSYSYANPNKNDLIVKGNIGIGVTNPSTKLEVSGLPNYASLILGNENFIAFKRSDGKTVYGIGHTLGEFIIGSSANLGPTAGTPINIATGGSYIRFLQGAQERMRVADNGYIGIGTTIPDAKLTVNGDIHSEEVRVEAVGADFVFASDYNLMTLTETEAYIKANHHLPEVPSTAEMQANGVELGKMNMLLLQKIEELTLHQIEMNKQLINQQKEIMELKLLLK